MNVQSKQDADTSLSKVVVPEKLSHFVIRTNNFTEMLAWYRFVFHAKTSFENEMIAFLTYDDEHHRFAFINTEKLPNPNDQFTGVDHVAFTYANLSDLLHTYKRLSDNGIKPFWCINHGPTTSMYYRDTDGNELEFQVDNFESLEEATKFFFSEAFALNPIGVDFDPDALREKLLSGVPELQLLRQGSAPVAPGMEHAYGLLPTPSTSN